MAHEDYYYKYGDHMPDGTPDTRWQTAPTRWLNRGHDVLADGAMGLVEGQRKAADFVYDKFMSPVMENPIDKKYYNDPLVSFFENKSNSVPEEGPMRFAGRGINPVTSGGPLSRGDPYKRYLGRMDERYRNGMPEYNTPNYSSIGYEEGQVDPGFYRTPPENPMYQNRVAINAGDSILEQELARFEAQLFADRDAAAAATEVFQNAVPYTTGVLAQEGRQLDKEANRSFSRGLQLGIQDTRSDWQKWKDSFKSDWEAK